MNPLPEKNESLWLLAASPLVWAAHFLLCYISAAVWCAKFADAKTGLSLGWVRGAIAAFTLAALITIAAAGVRGYRRHRRGKSPRPHDADSPEDRHRFLGFAAFLLSVLSGVAVLFAALVAVFFWSCH